MKDDDGGEIIVKITSISSVQKHKSQNFFFHFSNLVEMLAANF